jgi:hypothetical protein
MFRKLMFDFCRRRFLAERCNTLVFAARLTIFNTDHGEHSKT